MGEEATRLVSYQEGGEEATRLVSYREGERRQLGNSAFWLDKIII